MCSQYTAVPASHAHLPWIALRDFSSVRFMEEKIGGRPLYLLKLQPFNYCFASCGLSDLRCVSCTRSWSNRYVASCHIAARLDRVLCNFDWLDCMPHSYYGYFPLSTSDHSAISCGWMQRLSPSRNLLDSSTTGCFYHILVLCFKKLGRHRFMEFLDFDLLPS